MDKRIQIIVSPTGVATIRTNGFHGIECKAATRSLEQALGVPVNDLPTAEYYEVPVVSQSQTQSQ